MDPAPSRRYFRSVRAVPIAPAAVVAVGVAVALAMVALGGARLRVESDNAALGKARVLALAVAERVRVTPPEDLDTVLTQVSERTGADCALVEASGSILAETLVGPKEDLDLVSLTSQVSGFASIATGRSAYFSAELSAPFRHRSLIVFVHAPAAPPSIRAFVKAVAMLSVVLIGAAAAVAYAFSRNIFDDVEYVRRRIGQMAYEDAGPVGERLPVRTHDQIGELTSTFNGLVDRFAAAQRAYHADLAEADALDQARSRFLAALSHEMRTPLNAVLGFADVLLAEVDGPLTPSAREDLEIIRSSGETLRGLIDDILDLSAIETGTLRLQREDVAIGTIAEAVVREAQSLVRDRPVQLKLNIEGEPRAWVDPRRIRQIVTNLVSNAVKFTREGSVTVRVAPAEHGAVLEVHDTGAGMTEREQSTIFEEFRQVGEMSARRKGTGLGLAVARRLTLMHDGQLTVESTIDVGSTFKVWLPSANATLGVQNDALARSNFPTELSTVRLTGGAL